MRARRGVWLCLLIGLLSQGAAWAQTADLTPLLKTLRDVEPQGKGHRAATRAWSELTAQAGAEQLPQILLALDDASPLAANWLRSAVDAIAERQLRDGGKLDVAGLEKFLNDKKHDGRARRLAYEWIARSDPSASDRLIPRMLDDPSLELRRDAVARILKAADQDLAEKKNDPAKAEFRRALAAARDLDQVRAAADALKKLGEPVELARHFGFLQDWQLVGPFDNAQGSGFDTVYPPEHTIDLKASYPTAGGPVHWIAHHTDEEYGFVDVNKAIGKHMSVVGYALAQFQSDRAQPIELRLGTENANKIWLNGKLIEAANVYHANGTMDQYVGRGELQKGRNVILVKLCQNAQKEDWAQDWKFQLRVCDPSGKAVLSTDRPAGRAPADQTAAVLSQE